MGSACGNPSKDSAKTPEETNPNRAHITPVQYPGAPPYQYNPYGYQFPGTQGSSYYPPAQVIPPYPLHPPPYEEYIRRYRQGRDYSDSESDDDDRRRRTRRYREEPEDESKKNVRARFRVVNDRRSVSSYSEDDDDRRSRRRRRRRR